MGHVPPKKPMMLIPLKKVEADVGQEVSPFAKLPKSVMDAVHKQLAKSAEKMSKLSKSMSWVGQSHLVAGESLKGLLAGGLFGDLVEEKPMAMPAERRPFEFCGRRFWMRSLAVSKVYEGGLGAVSLRSFEFDIELEGEVYNSLLPYLRAEGSLAMNISATETITSTATLQDLVILAGSGEELSCHAKFRTGGGAVDMTEGRAARPSPPPPPEKKPGKRRFR